MPIDQIFTSEVKAALLDQIRCTAAVPGSIFQLGPITITGMGGRVFSMQIEGEQDNSLWELSAEVLQ